MYSIQDQLLDVVKGATQNVCYNSEDEKPLHQTPLPFHIAKCLIARGEGSAAKGKS